MVDLGTPIIPCVLGNICIEKALLHLVASVNVLPRYFYNIFQLCELKPIPMTIQLADRFVKVPRSVLEDILLKVGDYIFIIDFIVLWREWILRTKLSSFWIDHSWPPRTHVSTTR